MNKKQIRNALGVLATAACVLPPCHWGVTIVTAITTVTFFLLATALFAKNYGTLVD